MGRTDSPMENTAAIEAADWLMELADTEAPRLAGFAAWLKASPKHVEEFLLASAIWRELDALDPGRRIVVDALIAEARRNVQELPGRGVAAAASSTATRRSPARLTGIGALALALAATLATVWIVNPAWLGGPVVYRTDKGEQRTVKLEDGSVAHLNTDSRISVRYDADGRRIELLRGEALFDVERDARRPFVVMTDVAAVRAVGTQFDVYRLQDGGTTVSVVKGLVEIASPPPALLARLTPGPAPAAAAPARITAGEQAHVADRGQVAVAAVPEAVAQAVAWRERRLVFRGDTLADVAREFNRYNQRTIRIEDASVASKQLSGVFDADDPESLLQFLGQDPELRLNTDRDQIVVRAAAGS